MDDQEDSALSFPFIPRTSSTVATDNAAAIVLAINWPALSGDRAQKPMSAVPRINSAASAAKQPSSIASASLPGAAAPGNSSKTGQDREPDQFCGRIHRRHHLLVVFQERQHQRDKDQQPHR